MISYDKTYKSVYLIFFCHCKIF